MIYLVSEQQDLFEDNDLPYQRLSPEAALYHILNWDRVQYDSETEGRNPHLCKILCIQFGNKKADIQIVIDTVTVDIMLFAEVFDGKRIIITQNGKFDYQFLFNYGIVPTNNWDTMVVEQALHLGYDPKYFHVSLKAICERRLGIDIDKTVRGEIIWRGLDAKVIVYAAGDVMYLEDIMEQQQAEIAEQHCEKAIQIENKFVTWIAYLEWCGIKLDEAKWKRKMQENERLKNEALSKLNKWLVKLANENWIYKKFTNDDPEDLFRGQFDEECIINWNSSSQVVELCKMLGFNTKTEDKKTGESKDSVVEKLLKKQKGINDEFLKLYFAYTEKVKDCSTYGQTYLDAINPKTGRIHTKFKQLGASSGRMSCGGGNKDHDTDLAKYKHIPESRCVFVQIQNLPADDIVDGIHGYTRTCFVPKEGNIMCSCDFSAMESRLGADIYQEQSMINEFLYGSGDIHSLTAKACFPEELDGIDVKDIKELRPDLRKMAKGPEFACQFGGGAKAIANTLGISYQEAKRIENNYKEGFSGITKFKERGSTFVRNNGYIIINRFTGLRIHWEDWKKWKEYDNMPEELQKRELTADELKEHNMGAAKWDRMALNSPTQGSGAEIIKLSMILFGNYILKHGLFGTVLLCDLVHDEGVIEFPKELQDVVPNVLKQCMENAASQLCKSLPIPAVPECGDHWIH